MKDSVHAVLRGPFHHVLCLVQWDLPTMCQSDIVHGPLTLTRVDMSNVICLWCEVVAHQHHLSGGPQGSTKILIIGDTSSIILQAKTGLSFQWGSSPQMVLTGCNPISV